MKQTKKQIEAALRNKMAAQYTNKVADLNKEIDMLRKSNKEYRERAYKAEQEKLELQDKVNQYEDWNNRLQEFMDMSDEDRAVYVENLKKTKELNDMMDHFVFYEKMLGTLFV